MGCVPGATSSDYSCDSKDPPSSFRSVTTLGNAPTESAPTSKEFSVGSANGVCVGLPMVEGTEFELSAEIVGGSSKAKYFIGINWSTNNQMNSDRCNSLNDATATTSALRRKHQSCIQPLELLLVSICGSITSGANEPECWSFCHGWLVPGVTHRFI